MTEFFSGVDKVQYEGPGSDNPLAYHYYDADRVVLGKSMRDQLRMAVCYWHSFVWPGSDIFGSGTFDRPWNDPSANPMDAARMKMDAAFEFFAKLGLPFWCFHDADIAPDGSTYAETRSNFEAMDHQQSCASCHQPHLAGNSCLQCHLYHQRPHSMP